MDSFHPIIQRWFSDRYGSPTDIQQQAWPEIASDKHLLITAPTGSGKTLTAFLWAINRFAIGELATGATRVLYISPLKALNNDIERNLLSPLAELRQAFDETRAETPFPDVRVMTRSGDTDPHTRQRMLRHPPEILITTPESLNLMLSSIGGQSLLQSIDTLILDEIHAIAESKRGVLLMSAVERLVPLNSGNGKQGEFQRLALSATVNPLEQVAMLVGGYRREGDSYIQRPVDIIRAKTEKSYELAVRALLSKESSKESSTESPTTSTGQDETHDIWADLAADLLPRIQRNQSTLVFVNSRALCEKLTFKINQAAGRLVAWAHHGSLAREIRAEVESHLKKGQLEAIVATSSLEMGIDIGALDEVILVQSPGSIASTIQRIGRAGHQVDATSRCTIYPTHPQDFIESAVLADAVMAGDIEPLKPVSRPLDVLSQVLISMTGTAQGAAAWHLDDLFREVRRATPYQQLTRLEFDLVINMLAGRYADHHIRELKPRIRIDADGRVEARKGALLSLYLGGGVIPDRGYFQLRHEDDNARIGELDEEFVWEARVGQVFSLGTQTWQIRSITHNDVIVGHGKSSGSAPPFWRAESISRSFHYAQKIGQFLEAANGRLDDPDFADELTARYRAEPEVADEIIAFLSRQKEATGTDLPHRHHLLVEKIEMGPARAPGHQLVLHTGWGARVNRPLALALEAAWQQQHGEQPEVFVANESLVVQLPDDMDANNLLGLVTADAIEPLLRQRLEGSGFFGARFRENAGRALLLAKGRFNERKPLWMSRLQSQKLLDQVTKYEDFPILLETWRTCLRDEFDLDALRQLLDEINQGDIRVTEVMTPAPSPFAASLAWDQINVYMYMTDAPQARSGKESGKESGKSNLATSLLEEVVHDPQLRPALDPALVEQLRRRLHRLEPGYVPTDATELLDWVVERSFIPAEEWRELMELANAPANTLANTSANRPANNREAGGIDVQSLPGAVAEQDSLRLKQLLTALKDKKDGQQQGRKQQGGKQQGGKQQGGQQEDEQAQFAVFLANWLQHYGPLKASDMAAKLGLPVECLQPTLEQLVDDETLIQGRLIADDQQDYYCDAANYEHLLRLARQASRPEVPTRGINELPAFMFKWQTGFSSGDPVDCLFESIERLRGYPAAPELWETEIFPARIRDYSTAHLDQLFSEGELQWRGFGDKQVGFFFRHDTDLPAAGSPSALVTEPLARYDFNSLADLTGQASHELASKLWQEVWQGIITNDAIATLRQGILNRFEVPAVAPPDPPAASRRVRSRRGNFNRWRGATPDAGAWYCLTAHQDDGLLAGLEADKDQARLLLHRYGLVFRELMQRETALAPWKDIFRALRLMELSGEVVSGRFFDKIPGPQYMTPQGLRLFMGLFANSATNPDSTTSDRDPAKSHRDIFSSNVFFLNAADPLSPAGLGLKVFDADLPARVPGNHLVIHGGKLALTSRRHGRALHFHCPADDDNLEEYLDLLHHLAYRSFEPVRGLQIEEINGEPARTSPWLAAIEKKFNVIHDHKSVIIQREL